MFGLRPGSYSDGILRHIAHIAEGNARIAIQILRNAALNADGESSGTIKLRHVKVFFAGKAEFTLSVTVRTRERKKGDKLRGAVENLSRKMQGAPEAADCRAHVFRIHEQADRVGGGPVGSGAGQGEG
jgi:hypothetical protein